MVSYCVTSQSGVKIIFGKGTKLMIETRYDKIIFGKGIRLIVETRQESPPEYYMIEKDTTCLVTGFTKENRTKDLQGPPAVRFSGESYYSKVFPADKANCPEPKDNCESKLDIVFDGSPTGEE
ncbi:hypothetical protein NFI96_018586 [Prochilodus magdalenae]|nr:hypothetical protein NFI96_018586 [Prochilodus magdalenae]